MGRKKGHIVTLKPFCYYCDKEFNNELILHQHQKARHFNCVKCRKRFSTAPALDTHEIQVHRSSLKRVPNAKAGRDSFDISIYGMDGVPMELIKFKLAEKVEQKKRKLIKENKMVGNIEEKNGNKVLNYLDIKEQKDKDIRDLLMKTSEQGGEGFYHNPDSINLTLKQNQMKSMFINRPSQQNNSSNLYGNNNDKNNIKQKNKNKEKDKEKKVKEKEEKNEKEKETGILSLEQLNKELD